MEPKIYALNEIPAEVMQEISAFFKSVKTDNYSTIDENTRSFKSRATVSAGEDMFVMITVRGNINDETGEFCLRQVAASGLIKEGDIDAL